MCGGDSVSVVIMLGIVMYGFSVVLFCNFRYFLYDVRVKVFSVDLFQLQFYYFLSLLILKFDFDVSFRFFIIWSDLVMGLILLNIVEYV